jgi:hypothetical protein
MNGRLPMQAAFSSADKGLKPLVPRTAACSGGFLITVDEALNDVYNKAETGVGYAYLSLNPAGAPFAAAAVLYLDGKLAAKEYD